MSMKEIADKADVIIDGFAILKEDNDRYAVVNINRPGHSTVFKKDGSDSVMYKKWAALSREGFYGE